LGSPWQELVGEATLPARQLCATIPLATVSYIASYVIDYKRRDPYIRPRSSVQSVVSTLLR
jgi:hypothetical protein